jgi:predicted Rossmann fold nucleotide-binding protein DprA/Smf involved in DNA uptake
MAEFTVDSRFVALLCCPLPASDDMPDLPSSLSPKQWHILNERLQQSEFQHSSELLDADIPALSKHLNLTEPEADQIRRRLQTCKYFDGEIQRLTDIGIWLITAIDSDYPPTLREQLGTSAPPILFGCGNPQSLGQGGLAIVGPRNAADTDLLYAKNVGEHCASEGIQVISGAAKGIDQLAMTGAMEVQGQALGVLGDSLEKHASKSDIQDLVSSGRLTLISPYHPQSHFDVGKAMGRNKLIYALADWALVVACQKGSGGTWQGAATAMKSVSVPVFVRSDNDIPEGNDELIKRGALEFPKPPWANLANSLENLCKEYRQNHQRSVDQPGLFNKR